MEKLIELLNEYAHTYADHYDDTGEEIEIKFLEHTDNCFIYYCDGKFDSLVDDTVISKRFGFISWLVENDKIDTSKANDKNLNGYEIELRIRAVKELVADSEEKTVLYLKLLMLLSISDTPIEDLISYLR